MPGFFKHLFDMFKRKDDTALDTATKAATGNVTTESAVSSAQKASEKYASSDSYVRNEIVDQAAMNKFKNKAFSSGETVKDPYTGNELVRTQAEAKLKYGDQNYAEHSPEPDHIIPLEKIYKQFKNDPFATVDDKKRIANGEGNMVLTSRKYNNAKRSRSNSEFVNDDEYLCDKGVKLTEEGRQRALQDEIDSQKYVNKEQVKNFVSRASETFHEAGANGAIAAGQMTATMSGITNVVAVINGEKTADEAICDIAKDSVKSTATGYLVSGSTTTVAQAFSKSSNELVKLLTNANVSGKIISTVIITYDTVEKYVKGEITTNQCVLELGEKGSVLATSGYSMMIGQAVIPIPIVGAAIGALVGASLTSGIYKSLTSCLQKNEAEYQEMQRVIDECNAIAEEERRYRAELEKYLEQYFKEYRYCFSTALSAIDSAFASGDVDGVISGANQITKKLGGNVYYENFDEFKNFLASDEVDVF